MPVLQMIQNTKLILVPSVKYGGFCFHTQLCDLCNSNLTVQPLCYSDPCLQKCNGAVPRKWHYQGFSLLNARTDIILSERSSRIPFMCSRQYLISSMYKIQIF